MTDETSLPNNVSATWENMSNTQFLVPGAATAGKLIIVSSDVNAPLTAQNTSSITITIQQEGWLVDAVDGSPWQYASTDTDQGVEEKGTRSYTLVYQAGGADPFQADGSVDVNLTITPPDSGAEQVLYVSVNSPASPPATTNPASVAVSFQYPDYPLNVYGLDSAVILVNSDDSGFANVLSGEIANTSNAEIQPVDGITCTLSLYANTATEQTAIDGSSVLVTSTLDTVSSSWTYDETANYWTITLASIEQSNSLVFWISNLFMYWDKTEADLTTSVTAKINIAGVTDDSYDTSILFVAYGPYTIDVALNPNDSSVQYYTTSSNGNGSYTVNPLSESLNEPPLLVSLIDVHGSCAQPPVGGYFSWTSQSNSNSFETNHTLDDGDNLVYFVVPQTISDVTSYQNLTTATIDLSFSPQTICALGFEQTYGSSGDSALLTAPGTIMMWSGAPGNIPAGWILCDGANGTPNYEDRFIVGRTDDTQASTGNATSFAVSNAAATVHSVSGHTHGKPSSWSTTSASKVVAGHHAIHFESSSDVNTATASAGGHTHSISSWTGLDVVCTEQDSGSGPIRPEWYALCFIMKL